MGARTQTTVVDVMGLLVNAPSVECFVEFIRAFLGSAGAVWMSYLFNWVRTVSVFILFDFVTNNASC